MTKQYKPWIDEVIKKSPAGTLHQAPVLPTDHSLTALINYFKEASFDQTYLGEEQRGIKIQHQEVTVEDKTKTVLYRNAMAKKTTLSEGEKNTIANTELNAHWYATVAAACKYAEALKTQELKKAFITELLAINNSAVGHQTLSDHFKTKQHALHSLLGAFFEPASLEDICAQLEAERDMIMMDSPASIIATFYQDTLTEATLYEIEIPQTQLCEEQKNFFRDVQNYGSNDINFTQSYPFFATLTPWQQKMTRDYADLILQENRIRPSQMNFLPMAPNFWTKCTVIAAKNEESSNEIINSISRHGALSARLKNPTHQGVIGFQTMQYAQVRENFGLQNEDKLCVVNYMQNVPVNIAPDGAAAENLRALHNTNTEAGKLFAENNHLFSIPMGGKSKLYRLFRPVFELYYGTPFANDKMDVLLDDAFSIVGTLLKIKDCHAAGNRITIDTFMSLDNSYSDEIKLDLEEVYRHAMKIHELRDVWFYADNLRIAALRTTLYHKLCELVDKLENKNATTNTAKMFYKAYTGGCKSSIDRGTLVALESTVLSVREHARRVFWSWSAQNVPKTSTPIHFLNTKNLFVESMLYLSRISIPIINWLPQIAVAMINYLLKVTTGKSLQEHHARLTYAMMIRDLPGINEALTGTEIDPVSKKHLYRQKAQLINKAVKADLSIEASICQAGHSRAMPAHGGSFGSPNVKKNVVDEVAPHLAVHHEHLTGETKVASYNHGLAKKIQTWDMWFVSLYDNDAWKNHRHIQAAKVSHHKINYTLAPAMIGAGFGFVASIMLVGLLVGVTFLADSLVHACDKHHSFKAKDMFIFIADFIWNVVSGQELEEGHRSRTATRTLAISSTALSVVCMAGAAFKGIKINQHSQQKIL